VPCVGVEVRGSLGGDDGDVDKEHQSCDELHTDSDQVVSHADSHNRSCTKLVCFID
jgi:hypothetical protein